MSYVIITVGGIVTDHAGTPSLEDMQAAVGGYVNALPAMVRDGDGAVLFVNEDGKSLGMSANTVANNLYRDYGLRLMPGDVIVGPALVAGLPEDDEGDISDLSDGWLALLKDLPLPAYWMAPVADSALEA
jgi:hypothetical protein